MGRRTEGWNPSRKTCLLEDTAERGQTLPGGRTNHLGRIWRGRKGWDRALLSHTSFQNVWREVFFVPRKKGRKNR